MLFNDVAYLITAIPSVNAAGDAITTNSEKLVYCNKKSIRQTEFYQAQASGLRPELMLEVRSIDYSGEEQIRFGAKTYNIIRTFDKNNEFTELICQGLVSH
jgi:hypothetical protein